MELIGCEQSNIFCLKKSFSLSGKILKATLEATALGVYFVEVNGKRVGNAFMRPGWTSYRKTLQLQTYDLTEYLSEKNELALTVGKGWYVGKIGQEGNRYGDKTAVYGKLTVKTSEKTYVVSTDSDWVAESSFIEDSEIYDGEKQNFVKPKERYTTVQINYPSENIVPQCGNDVENIGKISPVSVRKAENGVLYDFGQNLTGVLEIGVQADTQSEKTLTVHFAETLDKNGAFYTKNYGNAKCEDVFTFVKSCVLCPEFTFRGFRYALLTGDDDCVKDVKAVVRHTKLEKTLTVSSSDERLNKLMQNIEWGQRDNFFDIPSDCPQRSERLGWTGDVSVFCKTSAYQFDVRDFYKKWLRSLRDDQEDDGGLPCFSPDASFAWKGVSALWQDVIVLAPWTLYNQYNDKSFLSDNFSAIEKYVGLYKKQYGNSLIASGFEYGDWLALDGEQEGNTSQGGTDVYYIANVFYYVVLETYCKILSTLGKPEKKEKDFSERLLEKIREKYFLDGRLVYDTQTSLALALHFGIAPTGIKQAVAERLNGKIVENGYRLETGFVGTPYLLSALAENGYKQTADKLLMQWEYPSWLYEVEHGATTVWERWDAIRSDGTLHEDEMNSLNHYAFGSVKEYVVETVAGIAPLTPGFEKVAVSPSPIEGVERLTVEYKSVNGTIVSKYEKTGEGTVYTVSVGENQEVKITLPKEPTVYKKGGTYTFIRKD